MASISANMFPLAAPGVWNFKRLAAAFAIAFVLQTLSLPCLCEIGSAKMGCALALDLLVALRVGIAYLARERGDGWRFYAWLIGTSPVWITAAAYLVLGSAG